MAANGSLDKIELFLFPSVWPPKSLTAKGHNFDIRRLVQRAKAVASGLTILGEGRFEHGTRRTANVLTQAKRCERTH